jgi:hypothetical protein
MQNLLIEQRSPSGLVKRWRLRSEQGSATFGHSKHADMRTSVDSIKGIQGVFEYRNGKWFYVNLDLQTVHTGTNGSEICLDKITDLNMGVSTLTVTPLEMKAAVFSMLEKSESSKPDAGKSPYQIYTVYQSNQLVESKLVPIGSTFVSKFDKSKTKFVPAKSDVWKKTNIGDIEVSERTVYLSEVDALKTVSSKEFVDDSSKKSFYATMIASALLTILYLFQPETNTLDEILTPIPPAQVREMKLEPKPKKQAQSAPAEQKPTQSVSAPSNKGGSSKAASAIKSLASGRISQLLGKVSASAARSNHVVVTSGIRAGSAPSGRALAALGSIAKSGKDWAAEGNGTGITISTKGKAGGQGVAGLGNMAVGKTGSGGAELLEEEGEIVGGLDREVIAAYIKSQLGQILYCYERQLSANPDLYGKVAVKFTIVADGTVDTQRIGDTTLKNATVEGCILQRVARWKFPAPEGGTKVLVTYPFLFKSTN